VSIEEQDDPGARKDSKAIIDALGGGQWVLT